MTYDLYIGDESFSSWSLRGWLMFEMFDIPVRVHTVGLYSGTMARDLADLAPARLVPVMRSPHGVVVGDTLAMAETLAEAHPDAGLWPKDAAARALARWMVAEMHSGFTDLRGQCPMQLLHQVPDFPPSAGTRADLERIQSLWALARARHGENEEGQPWLFGRYSLADVFFAPVAARIAGYGLAVSDQAARYVDAHLSEPAFRRWRALGLLRQYDPLPYDIGSSGLPWPGPTPIPARPIDSGADAVNERCLYSGKPNTHFLQAGGRVFGFCNARCRDKTVLDPGAWPAFMAAYAG